MGKTHVILPDELVGDIDRVVKRRGRSQFIMEAAREKLERIKQEIALAKAAGAWKDENHPDIVTQEDVNRYLQEIRMGVKERLRKRYNE